MSHMITKNMIAWKGETPWHGLGYKVDDLATGEDMLKVAKLDWKVQRRAIAMRDAEGREMLTTPLAGYKAIVRADTDEVFQVATNRYHPIQNSEIVDFFREYCEAGHATMETVGGLQGGSKVWALARLNGGSSANLQGVDELKGYMLLATSHDGSLRTIGKPTQVRVVCWNTLSAAIGEDSKAEFRMKRSKKFTSEVKEEAKKIMGMAIESVKEVNKVAETLSHIHIDQQGRIEFIAQLLSGKPILDSIVEEGERSILDKVVSQGEKPTEESLGRVGKAILECMMDSPGSDLITARNTMWGAVNGVTYYADHLAGRTRDNGLANGWFGLGAQLKQDAMDTAMEMAGVRVR